MNSTAISTSCEGGRHQCKALSAPNIPAAARSPSAQTAPISSHQRLWAAATRRLAERSADEWKAAAVDTAEMELPAIGLPEAASRAKRDSGYGTFGFFALALGAMLLMGVAFAIDETRLLLQNGRRSRQPPVFRSWGFGARSLFPAAGAAPARGKDKPRARLRSIRRKSIRRPPPRRFHPENPREHLPGNVSVDRPTPIAFAPLASRASNSQSAQSAPSPPGGTPKIPNKSFKGHGPGDGSTNWRRSPACPVVHDGVERAAGGGKYQSGRRCRKMDCPRRDRRSKRGCARHGGRDAGSFRGRHETSARSEARS